MKTFTNTKDELLAAIDKHSRTQTDREEGVFITAELSELLRQNMTKARDELRRLIKAGRVKPYGRIQVLSELTGEPCSVPAYQVIRQNPKTK
jgi:hypothetical protein